MSSNNLRKSYIIWGAILIYVLCVTYADSSPRVMGNLSFQGYGYTDADQVDHLYLEQNLNMSIYHQTLPISFYFSGNYYGDMEDDFGESAEFRFLRGYVQYGNPYQHNYARLGRFFLYSGALIGSFDGIETKYALNNSTKLGMFIGMSGPLTRKFEFDEPDKSFAFGFDVSYRSKDMWLFKRPVFSIDYAYQMREEDKIHHRVSMSHTSKIDNHWSLYGHLRLRMADEFLQRGILRVRYVNHNISGILEAATYQPEIAEASWFKDFEMPRYHRVRTAWQGWIIPDLIGAGIDVAGLINYEGYSWRLGPLAMFKYGFIGYRFSTGDHSKSEGLWANINYSPTKCVNAYANVAITTYEWEAIDLESNELQTYTLGGKWTPPIRDDFTLGVEYQVYSSPQMDRDSRALGSITWRFDTRGKK